jgi:hypothetical protein
MNHRPCFVGQVRLDGGPWQEVCRARTLEACMDRLFAYEPPANVIAVERRAVASDQADSPSVRTTASEIAADSWVNADRRAAHRLLR